MGLCVAAVVVVGLIRLGVFIFFDDIENRDQSFIERNIGKPEKSTDEKIPKILNILNDNAVRVEDYHVNICHIEDWDIRELFLDILLRKYWNEAIVKR